MTDKMERAVNTPYHVVSLSNLCPCTKLVSIS